MFVEKIFFDVHNNTINRCLKEIHHTPLRLVVKQIQIPIEVQIKFTILNQVSMQFWDENADDYETNP